MKKRYQIDQQRAVQEFRRFATDRTPTSDAPSDGRRPRFVAVRRG